MIEADVERELQNWALWYASGGWCGVRGSASMSPIYQSDQDGYREAHVPILAGAASDVDDLVNALLPDHNQALRIWYVRIAPDGKWMPAHATQADMARRLRIAPRTFTLRLEVGRRRIADGLATLRRRTEALRDSARP